MPEALLSNRNIARGQATREHIVAVATRLFAEHGFDGASIDLVLRSAGVSRGALYHHFNGKDALFQAVLEAVEVDVGRRVTSAGAGADDAYALLRAGCLAWVELAGDPVVRRILLIDAPAVLGWHQWRAMDERNTLGAIRTALTAMAAEGRLPTSLVDMFAHLLLASMNELALVIATAEEPSTAMRQAAAAVDEYLKRLLPAPRREQRTSGAAGGAPARTRARQGKTSARRPAQPPR
jgi:AcrR family transcriptional regulator